MTRVSAAEQYRRFDAALGGLAELAVGPHGGAAARALAGDDLVLARMRMAAAVIEEAGLPVRVGGTPEELLRHALGWQRYAAGPVTALHADCGRALSRGLLRLWWRRRAGPGAPAPVRQRARLRIARARLAGEVRAQCDALRRDLHAVAAAPGGCADFAERAESRVRQVLTRLDEDLRAEVAAAGGDLAVPTPPSLPDLPPLRPMRLEHRLTWVFGIGFGVGAGVTAGRLAADVLAVGAGAASVLGAAAGLALGGWVVRIRRALSTRAARDRWAAEVSAALRVVLEEHIATELLAAEAATASGPTGERFSPVCA